MARTKTPGTFFHKMNNGFLYQIPATAEIVISEIILLNSKRFIELTVVCKWFVIFVECILTRFYLFIYVLFFFFFQMSVLRYLLVFNAM